MKEIKDVFNLIVRLTDERVKHILDSHPVFNLNDFETIVIETLQNPDQV